MALLYFALRLLAWVAVGALCLVLNYVLVDKNEHGKMWATGYVLELIFSVENVFIFQVVCHAFAVPGKRIQPLLAIVVLCQVVFQAVFFMGLGAELEKAWLLPYLLGLWLLYVGVGTARGDHDEGYNPQESFVYRFCSLVLGDRLTPEYDGGGTFCSVREDKVMFTPAVPVLGSLMLVDFLFEIDVTLTKIEVISGRFSNFSSSVVAACAMPELFFVAEGLLKRYTLLKYGISFVLIFYGLQLLLHDVFEPPALVGVVIVLLVFILCIALSHMLGHVREPTSHGQPEKAVKAPSGPSGDA